MTLSITRPSGGSVDYVRIIGDVDLADTPALEQAARLLGQDDGTAIYVDLAGVTFMGSTLAGFLLQLATSRDRADRPLVLCRPSLMASKVIRIAALDGIATLRPDLPPSWPDPAPAMPPASHAA